MDDNPTGTRFSKKGERRQNIFFDCILDLGFKDCIAETLEDYVQTHRHNLSKFPWQIDHFFASEKLFNGLTDLKVIDNEEVKFSGFGNFELIDKKPRPGRNPKTGEEVTISARRVVTFRAGNKLRKKIASFDE